ncbi:MAG: hypothetical protein ACYC4S_17945, partial [Rhodoferax sp.]
MKRAIDPNMDLFEALMDAIESPETHPNTSGQMDWLNSPIKAREVSQSGCSGGAVGIPGGLCGDDVGSSHISADSDHEGCRGDAMGMTHGSHVDTVGMPGGLCGDSVGRSHISADSDHEGGRGDAMGMTHGSHVDTVGMPGGLRWDDVGRSHISADSDHDGCRGDAMGMTHGSHVDAVGMSVGLCGDDVGRSHISADSNHEGCRGDAIGMTQGSHGDTGGMFAEQRPSPTTTNTSAKPTKPKKTIVKKYGKQALSQPYLFEMAEGDDPDVDDPIKKVNEAYRIRRDLNNESLDMPLLLLGLDIRAGIEKDDRKWNAIFSQAREEIIKEISYLRLVLGDKMKVEVDWQRPIGFPYVALRAQDGRRIVETDSQEMMGYGVRSATMLWKHILEKQKLMHKMAKDYSGLESIALHLPKAIKKAMSGTRSQKFTMTREIA